MDARDEAALARRDVLQPLDHAGAGVLQVGLVPRGEQRHHAVCWSYSSFNNIYI